MGGSVDGGGFGGDNGAGAPAWPARVSLAQLPTPLAPLRRLAVDGAPNIWLKRDDLTGFILSGNKVRKLEFVLARALAAGAGHIVTCGGMQSNHCRATAFACAQLGLKCHLLLRDTGQYREGGNYLLDQFAGADITLVSVSEYQAQLSELLESKKSDLELSGASAMIVPTGASDGLGIWGYAAAAFELLADFKLQGIVPRVVGCATGSGGTQAGLALGFALAGADIEVVGIAVCDDEAYFQHKVAEDLAAWQLDNPGVPLKCAPRYRTIDAYVGGGYARAGDAELKLALRMAQLEGVLLDPVYSGKAFYGLISELEQGRLCETSDIVFVHTGGGFGVFPYEEQLQSVFD